MGVDQEKQRKLDVRVTMAAEAALLRQQWVSPIDVLTGIGWLDVSSLDRWRRGQVPYLERCVQANLPRLSEAMNLFRAWATAKGLRPSLSAYVARTAARTTLRFSASGEASIEERYRTHWVSPELSEKKRERLKARVDRPPELVVIEPVKEGWQCHRCGATGRFLVMEPPGPACLDHAGLGGLEFLPAGDATLSRRAKAKSARHAVVVRFSRSRKRYERQGILVEPDALRAAAEAPAARDGHGADASAESATTSPRRLPPRTLK